MNIAEQETMISCGRRDCSDMHSWGPGIRTCYIVHYIIRGKGIFVRGNKYFRISAGESFLIRPFETVTYYPDESDPWEYTWIAFLGGKYLDVLKKINFSNEKCIIGFIPAEKIMPFYTLINEIPFGTCENTACGIALAILGKYADSFGNAEKSYGNIYFDCTVQLIKNNFHKPDFDLSVICKMLCISRATLHRSFITACGTSPGVYITQYRLERAKEFLKRGSSVKNTAASCGFLDPLYFSKSFKASFGMPPSEYKRTSCNKINNR